MSEYEMKLFWTELPKLGRDLDSLTWKSLLIYLDQNLGNDEDLAIGFEEAIDSGYFQDFVNTYQIEGLFDAFDFEHLDSVLISLLDEEVKYEYAPRIKDDKQRKVMMESIATYDEACQYLDNVVIDDDIDYVFNHIFLNNDECLKYVKGYVDKFGVDGLYLVPHLRLDESKLQILDLLVQKGAVEEDLEECAISLVDDELFLDALYTRNIEVTMVSYKRFGMIENDDLRRKYLDLVTGGLFRLFLILGINDDCERALYMSEYEADSSLVRLACECKYDEMIIFLLDYIQDDSLKSYAIKHMSSDECKIKALDCLANVQNKLLIVLSLDDDSYKKQFLEREKLDIWNQLALLLTMKDIDYRRNFVDKNFVINGKHVYGDGFPIAFDVYDAGKDALPGDLGFGLELEAVGYLALAILVYGGRLVNKYEVKEEDSLDSGLEMTSDILYYSEEDLKSIYQVCYFASLNELEADSDCGGHIHYSADYLDSYNAWYWLFYLYVNAEKLLAIMCNEEGKCIRAGAWKYAKFFGAKYVDILDDIHVVDTVNDFVYEVQKVCDDRNYAINLTNIAIKQDTIEFRIPNGTLNPDVEVHNILLFGRLLVLAKRLADEEENVELWNLLLAFDKEVDEENKVKILLDMLFEEDRNKEVFWKRYQANRGFWEESSNLEVARFGLARMKK